MVQFFNIVFHSLFQHQICMVGSAGQLIHTPTYWNQIANDVTGVVQIKVGGAM